GSLRLDLAAYRELEAFAQLGTELDAATQAQLDRGARMVELLKQGQYSPMPVTDQIISIYAGTQGFFDKVPLDKVREAERVVLKAMHESQRDLWTALNEAKVIDGPNEQKLRSVLQDVIGAFLGNKSYDPR
ncbi:MAG TPA: F0F1 ATP synthase subunit alpha, partial [bacterium]|nr:F0F1 ATP synthase subunit alpha [bacterium]